MKNANRAIGRTRFATHTVNNLVAKMSDANCFSKLGMISAFHQLELFIYS